MCNHKTETNPEKLYPEKKYRLADFFDSYWDIYTKSPKEYIQPEQYKAVNAIRVCRTAALGVDIYSCPDCGDITEVYHSCKNRFCPTCSWKDTVKWAERVKSQMINLPHRHVVFTLPHSLNHLIKINGKHLLNILMRTSADTFKDWISNKYGLKIGVISVLHTFGEKKDSHNHVHMIISWGGIDNSTGTLKEIKGEYVNYDFLKNKFRCKFEDDLVKMFDSGQLIHNFKSRIDFLQFLKRVNKKNWILHLEPPMELPSLVIRYIGRYSKRACLSEYKITQMEGEYISFLYKDYKKLDLNKKALEFELTLHYRDFFPRLLQHVPLPYFRIVRYYGLYSNRGEIPEEYLCNDTSTINEQINDWEIQEEEGLLYCSTCKRKKEYQHTVVEKRKTNKLDQCPMIVYKRSFWKKRTAA
jgi:hypothetical protein